MHFSDSAGTHTLVISCPDGPGLVAAVAGSVARHGGTLTESHNHTDHQHRWFFMRNAIGGAPEFYRDAFCEEFGPIAEEHSQQGRPRSPRSRR